MTFQRFLFMYGDAKGQGMGLEENQDLTRDEILLVISGRFTGSIMHSIETRSNWTWAR
jgi:hypothetical protein